MPYVGEAGFVDSTLPFVQDGLAAGEPVLVVTSAPKVQHLRSVLGDDGHRVEFAHMSEVGHNPANIIPAWRDFVDRFEGRTVRGLGEPIFAERTGAELVECLHHEALLNLAFNDCPGFSLLCPIDVSSVQADSVGQAMRRHPWVGAHEAPMSFGCAENREYESASILATLDDPLPEPSAPLEEFGFDLSILGAVRSEVGRIALGRGLGSSRCFDLTTAVNEAMSNSVTHGGGGGKLRIWDEPDRLLCEVSDNGRITDPLVGRRRPSRLGTGQRGVWMMNRLCDLVQVRSGPNGAVVRLHSKFSRHRPDRSRQSE
jgi:anti-sigma regulatory factor (Ser/Thr protein kinase)